MSADPPPTASGLAPLVLLTRPARRDPTAPPVVTVLQPDANALTAVRETLAQADALLGASPGLTYAGIGFLQQDQARLTQALPRPQYRVLQRAQFPRGLPFEGEQQSHRDGLAWPGTLVRSDDPSVIAAHLRKPGGGGALVAHDAVPWEWFGPAVAPQLAPPGDPARRRHHPGVARHIHPGTQGQQRTAFGLTWTALDDPVAWLGPAHAALMQGRLGPVAELPQWLLRAADTDALAAAAELEGIPPALRATWTAEDLMGWMTHPVAAVREAAQLHLLPFIGAAPTSRAPSRAR